MRRSLMVDIPSGVDLWQIPYQTPPPGVESDFNKRSELLVPVVVIVSIFISIQVVLLGLRIFTKCSRRDECWRLEDLCILLTVVMGSTLGAAVMAVAHPAGRHTWDISIGALTTAWMQRMLILQHILTGISLYLGKCCILTMYFRVFGQFKCVQYQIYLTLILATPLLFSSIYQPIVSAPPSGKPWGTPNPKVSLATRSALAVGIDNLLVDLVIFYIPLPHIAKLKISGRKKFGVLAIFLTGSIAIVADIVILYFRVELFREVDVLRYGMIVGACCVIEVAISVICSSMPIAAKFARIYIGKSSLFNSVRTRFYTEGSNSGYSRSLTLPSFIKKPDPARRKRDPYSLAMESTKFSATRLSQERQPLNLGEVPEGYLRLEPIIYTANMQGTVNPGEIQRTVSVWRTSSYQNEEPEKSSTKLDGP